jgi:hypothetical protein
MKVKAEKDSMSSIEAQAVVTKVSPDIEEMNSTALPNCYLIGKWQKTFL